MAHRCASLLEGYAAAHASVPKFAAMHKRIKEGETPCEEMSGIFRQHARTVDGRDYDMLVDLTRCVCAAQEEKSGARREAAIDVATNMW